MAGGRVRRRVARTRAAIRSAAAMARAPLAPMKAATSLIPEERERQRTQAVEEELRRRGSELMRPQQELDYINRLLKQF